jgi:hypothetical protein
MPVLASAIATESSSNSPYSSGETLYYKLSYRGLLTSMIWADLADITMTYLKNKTLPNQKPTEQFELALSTEHYSKAELFQPVRYRYITTLDSLRHRTTSIEEIDTGENKSHDVLWLDWEKKETQLFKKREKKIQSYGFLGMDKKEVWQKDGIQVVPDFLKTYPLLADQQSYFIHKESGDNITYNQILDPLSLIYTIRTLNFDSTIIQNIALALSDDIRLYQIKKMTLDELLINGVARQTIKYQIYSKEKEDHYYYIWLSDDNSKIPWRLTMDAPLGKLEITLLKVKK